MSAGLTRSQRAQLAHLVLAHGYDNLHEFWGEYDGVDQLPSYEICRPVLFAWHRRMIDLAIQAPPPPPINETTLGETP